MKSRVHPTYKTKYRVENWQAYDRALVQRGDVTLWLAADARDAWRPSRSGRPGGQQRFSDLAIETALTRHCQVNSPRGIVNLSRIGSADPQYTAFTTGLESIILGVGRSNFR